MTILIFNKGDGSLSPVAWSYKRSGFFILKGFRLRLISAVLSSTASEWVLYLVEKQDRIENHPSVVD